MHNVQWHQAQKKGLHIKHPHKIYKSVSYIEK